ncbi:MAG: hypothetical protein ACJASB_003851 [Shewanella psychromarinicola]|jgi:hypothetical protein
MTHCTLLTGSIFKAKNQGLQVQNPIFIVFLLITLKNSTKYLHLAR